MAGRAPFPPGNSLLLGKSFLLGQNDVDDRLALGGVAIAVKRKEQLRVLMLMDTLEKHFPRLVKVCYVVSELSFAVFCVLVFYYSINMLENMTRFKQVSASLEINVMYAYLIIPISMAVTTFRVLQGLYRDFRNHTLHFQGRGD